MILRGLSQVYQKLSLWAPEVKTIIGSTPSFDPRTIAWPFLDLTSTYIPLSVCSVLKCLGLGIYWEGPGNEYEVFDGVRENQVSVIKWLSTLKKSQWFGAQLSSTEHGTLQKPDVELGFNEDLYRNLWRNWEHITRNSEFTLIWLEQGKRDFGRKKSGRLLGYFEKTPWIKLEGTGRKLEERSRIELGRNLERWKEFEKEIKGAGVGIWILKPSGFCPVFLHCFYQNHLGFLQFLTVLYSSLQFPTVHWPKIWRRRTVVKEAKALVVNRTICRRFEVRITSKE